MANPTGKGGFRDNPQNRNGNGRRKGEADYLATMFSVVSQSDWKEIVCKAKDQAKRGDKDARNWLSGYLQGAPKQTVDMYVDILWDWELPSDTNL